MLKLLFVRFRWLILLASVLSTMSAILGIKMLTIITDAIGSVEKNGFEPSSSFSYFGLIVLGAMLLGGTSQYILAKLSATAVYEVQKTLLQRILATPYQVIEKNGSHKLMAAMKHDVSSIAKGITLFPRFLFSAVTVVLCLGYMVYTSWQLFLLVVLVLALIVVASQLILGFSRAYQRSLREDMDHFFSNLKALTNGGKELHIHANRKRNFYTSVMLPLFKSIEAKTVKTSMYFIALDSFSSTLVMFLVGCVVYTSLYLFPSMSASIIVSFTLIILYMVAPISNVVGVAGDFSRARASLDMISRLDLADAASFSLNRAAVLESDWKNLQFDRVTYKHDADFDGAYQFQLGPISAEFRAGEISFIVGGNGSGKSTLAKLIAGLYQPCAGSILLDDKNFSGEGFSQYARPISVIFSDFFIFPQILDNNGLAAKEHEVDKYLEKLKLLGKVSTENGVLSSVNLSTGQNKRLAMLQSYFDDAHVCLFDEWAADQDPSFKQYFYHVMLPDMKRAGKIVIVITHDDQYFNIADQVFKLDDGKLVNTAALLRVD